MPRRIFPGVGAAFALLYSGCAALPTPPAERGAYFDLRKIVEVNEDSGWTVDSTRLQLSLEPALRSVCQVEPADRERLATWLEREIRLRGGPARRAYATYGGKLSAIAEVLSLERTLALLRTADAHADKDCPFWLVPREDFAGEQTDQRRWVVLGETQAFGTVELPGPIPALGGGGRLLLGRGLSTLLTAAAGIDVAASGTFIPSSGSGSGVDAYVTVATPLLFRISRFSRIFDLELAPVVRFSPAKPSWPPGARAELGYGFSAVRLSAFTSYFMVYAGYEAHGFGSTLGLDHTVQLGTKLSVDWSPWD